MSQQSEAFACEERMWEESLAPLILLCLGKKMTDSGSHWSSAGGGVPPSHIHTHKKPNKIHVGLATGFGEMVPKPGPSRPAVQQGTGCSSQSVMAASWVPSISPGSPLSVLSLLQASARIYSSGRLVPIAFPIPK